MSKPLCCHSLRNCVWMAYWGSMSWNIFGRPLSFPRPPLCCAECSPRPDSRVFQKKGGEGFSQKHNIQKKPEKLGISLRENRAFKLNRVFRYKREWENAASGISAQEIGAHREEEAR